MNEEVVFFIPKITSYSNSPSGCLKLQPQILSTFQDGKPTCNSVENCPYYYCPTCHELVPETLLHECTMTRQHAVCTKKDFHTWKNCTKDPFKETLFYTCPDVSPGKKYVVMVDASMKHELNEDRRGFGIIIRKAGGVFIRAISQQLVGERALAYRTIQESESQALLLAFTHVKQMGDRISSATFYTDSEAVAKTYPQIHPTVSEKPEYEKRFHRLLQSCVNMAEGENVDIVYVPREVNRVADLLASERDELHPWTDYTVFYDLPPEFIRLKLDEDRFCFRVVVNAL